MIDEAQRPPTMNFMSERAWDNEWSKERLLDNALDAALVAARRMFIDEIRRSVRSCEQLTVRQSRFGVEITVFGRTTHIHFQGDLCTLAREYENAIVTEMTHDVVTREAETEFYKMFEALHQKTRCGRGAFKLHAEKVQAARLAGIGV